MSVPLGGESGGWNGFARGDCPVAFSVFVEIEELPDDFRDVLSHWMETSGDCEVAIPQAQGFSGAVVFQVRTEAGTFCLRQWPEGGLPTARLQELHRFLRFLAERGIGEVAVPIRASEGSTLVTVKGRVWQLEPWLPGAADVSEKPSSGRLGNVMRTLARLHLASAEYRSTAEGAPWFFQSGAAPSPAVLSRLKMIRAWDSNRVRVAQADIERLHELGAFADEVLRLFTQCRRAIEAELSEVRETGFRLQPCLRDVWEDHVLFDGDEVSGLIDPSAARSENVATDLSRLLGGLLGDDVGRWESALDTYSAVRPLSDRERGLVRVLDRSGVLLSPLRWVEVYRSPLTQQNVEVALHVMRRMNVLTTRLRKIAEEIGGI